MKFLASIIDQINSEIAVINNYFTVDDKAAGAANNVPQGMIFSGLSRVEQLAREACRVIGQLTAKMLPDSPSKVSIKRLLDLNGQNPVNTLAKKGVTFSAPTHAINSRPINLYNHGIPAEWKIEKEKTDRNTIKIFPTGDVFVVVSPDIEISGANINIHVGVGPARYSPLVLLHEALQLCRCAYEHRAQSITITLPEQFHPLLHYSDFNSLLIKLFKASGANRIYYYDQDYTGRLDESHLHAVVPLTLSNQEEKVDHLIKRSDLLDYLHNSKRATEGQDPLSPDYQVMGRTRQYNFSRNWSRFSVDKTDSARYVGHSDAPAEIIVPENKAQPHVLLCCSANKPLAEAIAASLRRQGEMVRLCHIQGQGAAAQIPADVAISGTVVTIVQSTRPNPDQRTESEEYQKNGASSYLFETAMIARQAQLRGAQTINLINPYQFSARSDKAENKPRVKLEDNAKAKVEEDSSGKTGAYVQQVGMLLEAAGVNHVITAECHDNHTMSGSYTSKKIRGSAVSALSVISSRLALQWREDNMPGKLCLVEPDAGAAKRTKDLELQLKAIMGNQKLCQNRILGEKQRDSHKDDSAIISSLNSGGVKINANDKYLITDDETATGTTLCQVIINLKEKGAENIAVIVVHNNMPLDWLQRQLYLARFLYLGVSDLHFSDTQEMGTLARSYDDLIQTQATIANVPASEIEKKVFAWFKNKDNIRTLADKTEAQVDEEFNRFKSLFQAFGSKIKIHSLANEFAHQVATKPYMGNPYAFDYKVNEYIRKIKTSQAQSIVVFEGASVAAASAAALALSLPLQVIPAIIPGTVNPKLSLPNQPFVLIGTPDELTLARLKKDTDYDGFGLLHTPSDPDADLAIVTSRTSLSLLNETSHPVSLNQVNSNMGALLSEIEKITQTIKQDPKLKETPIKLLGIGVEGQLLAGQVSYLLNKKGFEVGIAAVDNKQTPHASPVVYTSQSGDQLLSIDRNGLGMGDICIAVSRDMTNDTKAALHKLATAAKVHCSHGCSLSKEGVCEVAMLDSEPARMAAKARAIVPATKSGLLFFVNPFKRTDSAMDSRVTQNAENALASPSLSAQGM